MSKRELILATAKSMFIEKGFRGSTIANIAEKAGIAKGSVYSYFNSKLEIAKALFLQSDELNQQLVERLLQDNDVKGVQLLELYLTQEFQQVLNERAFIQVFLNEDMMVLDTEIMAVVQECRINYHMSQQQVLLQAYDKSITPWLVDIVALLNGLLQEYTIYLTLDQASFSIKSSAKLIAFCLDSSISALINSTVAPVLTAENFPLLKDLDTPKLQLHKANNIIESMEQETTDLAKNIQSLVLETLALIKTELTKTPINKTLLRALIANLRPYNELKLYRRRLADVLDIELI